MVVKNGPVKNTDTVECFRNPTFTSLMLQVVHHTISQWFCIFGKMHPRWVVCRIYSINKMLAKPEVAGRLPSTKSFH